MHIFLYRHRFAVSLHAVKDAGTQGIVSRLEYSIGQSRVEDPLQDDQTPGCVRCQPDFTFFTGLEMSDFSEGQLKICLDFRIHEITLLSVTRCIILIYRKKILSLLPVVEVHYAEEYRGIEERTP